MALHDLTSWRHEHAFDAGNRAGESRTWIVVAITAVMMVAEIVGGWLTGSMALLADGWHMGTHVAALSMAGIAYALARRWSGDERFAFGTWKIEVLGAFSSALVLAIVALAMAVESVLRLVSPHAIAFGQALAVAVIGLVVNVVSAFVLAGHDHGHDHDHGGDHDHGQADEHDHAHDDGPGHETRGDHGHGDLNLRAAYFHVIADAFTSVLAIVALAAGMMAGWAWLDPVMGIVGAGVIAWWSKGLLAQSARVLLDREMDTPVAAQVRMAIESDGDAEIADLHVWRVGRARYACIVAVVAREPLTPDGYRERLADIASLAHVSVEVNRCPHENCP
ncbi:MAG TPA: CDF family Co(II)/Ni(II) efflux transporter DmeF [Usitatibacteraceae bacterium]|nr:CDF family Co(II)/Ni(II) efflux transporter DmeF [Usitatibacteraceae bacterium]